MKFTRKDMERAFTAGAYDCRWKSWIKEYTKRKVRK